jgi:carbamoylphosphate synthase large subunit
MARTRATPRVLVSSGGSGTAWGVAASLRDAYEDLDLTVCDINPRDLVATASLADRFVQIPLVADSAFRDRIEELVAAEAIDAFFPVHDAEIVAVAELVDEGRLPSECHVMCPPLWSAVACFDKLACFELLQRNGLPTPQTWSLPDAEWPGTSLCVKPRRGVGSAGVRYVGSATQLVELQAAPDAPDFCAQELLDEPEITIDCFRDATGAGYSMSRERLEVKSGVSTKCRVFADPELHELGLAVGEAFSLVGSYCFQVMRATDGWAITDVNPRTGAGTRMCAAVGANFPAASLALALSDDPLRWLPEFSGNAYVARHYSEVVLAHYA